MKKSILLIVLILVFTACMARLEKVKDEKEENKISVREDEEWFKKGYKAYAAKNYNYATEYFKKAIALNPNLVKAHYSLGLVYERKNMLDEAISEYKKALNINPDYPPAHYKLGHSLLKKGLNSLGAEHLYKAGILFLKEGNRGWAMKAYRSLKQTESKELEKSLYEQLYPKQSQADSETSI